MSTQVAYFEAWIQKMRSWGFTVHEAAGWRTRDAEPRSKYLPGMLHIEHHDASSTRSGNWGALNYIINNRLANIVTARDGQITVVAAGVAWHAGVGSRNSLGDIPVNGANPRSMGNEVANSGSEPYDPRCTRAIIAAERAWAEVSGRVDDIDTRILGHKEWADPPGRKSDPSIDMNQRRRDVAAFRPGPAPAPTPPAPKPTQPDPNVFPLPRDEWFGDIDGPDESHGGWLAEERIWVTWIQDKLRALGYRVTDPIGEFRQSTIDAVSAFQRDHTQGTTFFGQVWHDDWRILFSLPVPVAPQPPPVTPPVVEPPAPPVVEIGDPEPGSLLRTPVEAGTYRITSGFGKRNGADHRGVDFASVTPGKDYSGARIYAAEDGVVIEGSERQNVGGFGGWVWIEHKLSDGRVVDTIYGHVYQRDVLVKKGDRVKRGQLIAKVGNNGDSTGAHLHFEVWTSPGREGGTAVDPMPYLLKAEPTAPPVVEPPKPEPQPEPPVEPEPEEPQEPPVEPAPEPEPEPEPETPAGPPADVRSALQVLLDYLRDLFGKRR